MRHLVDKDGDGVFESSTVFADNIRFPNGVMLWRDGILVTAAPDILFFADRDGDGRAEIREKVLSGFAEGNQQLRVNGLFYGLDNWIYGANGRSDGTVFWSDSPTNTFSIRRRDFRFRPDAREFEAIAGNSQFGLAHDNWGNRFQVYNNIPVRTVVIEDRLLQASPVLASVDNVPNISPPDDRNKLFPISPPVQSFQNEPPGYFTSACGIFANRDHDLGDAYFENIFVCEPVQNLVHRRILETNGMTFKAVRPDTGREFLASRDPWFHPVFMAAGPDGALYIVDFYRKFVEHPHWVPDSMRNQVDWSEGKGHGRIWRVRRKDAKAPQRTEALLSELADAHSFWRDHAQRQIVSTHATQFTDGIRASLNAGLRADAVVQAMYTLQGLGELGVKDVLGASRNPSPGVREAVARLSSNFLSTNERQLLLDALQKLAADSDIRVRAQVALALAVDNRPEKVGVLLTLINGGVSDSWFRTAVAAAAANLSFQSKRALLDRTGLPGGVELILQLIAISAAASEPESQEALRYVCAAPLNERDPFSLLVALNQGLTFRSQNLGEIIKAANLSAADRERLDIIGARATQAIADRDQSMPNRIAAVKLVANLDSNGAESVYRLLKKGDASEVENAAVDSVLAANSERMLDRIFADWPALSRNARRRIISQSPKSVALAERMISAAERGVIQTTEIDLPIRYSVRTMQNPTFRPRVEALFSKLISSDRQKVIDAFLPAASMKGAATHGGQIFSKTCMSCHKVEGKGADVGPDLSGIGSHSNESLTEDILDPSRKVVPDYLSYGVRTSDGEVIAGVIVKETADSVTVRRPSVPDATIPRAQIREIKAEGKSLMPEGLEVGLSPQDFADLLEFLRKPKSDLLD